MTPHILRFYRYVLGEEPMFSSQGRSLAPSVSFQDLPSKQLLTLNIIAPDPWMVQSVFAEHDLDNIKMENVSGVQIKVEIPKSSI
jgi:UDP-glucose:glycoprotein glucosyltransferase